MLQPTRLISTPFAQEGEKTEIQNVTGEFDNSATYRIGFPPKTMQSIRLGGKPPKGTDFNGIFFDITENISFLCKGGRYQYNAGLSTLIGGYPEGSNLLLDDNVTEVVSTVAGNQNNPNTDMTGWILKPVKVVAEDVIDGNQTQDQINLFGGKKYDMPVGGYPLDARVLLDNGDIVKSTIPNNTNDPNVNMTGWVLADSGEAIGNQVLPKNQSINSFKNAYSPKRVDKFKKLRAMCATGRAYIWKNPTQISKPAYRFSVGINMSGYKTAEWDFISDADGFYRMEYGYTNAIRPPAITVDATNMSKTPIRVSDNAYFRSTDGLNASFDVVFNGQGLIFNHYVDSNGGIFEVKVDGVLVGNVSTNASNPENSGAVAMNISKPIINGLPSGSHTASFKFIGNDPLYPPSSGTSRGWFKLSDGTEPEAYTAYVITGSEMGRAPTGSLLVSNGILEFAISATPTSSSFATDWVPAHGSASGCIVVGERTIYIDNIKLDDALSTISSEQEIKEFTMTQRYTAYNSSDTEKTLPMWEGEITTKFDRLNGLTWNHDFGTLNELNCLDGYTAMCSGQRRDSSGNTIFSKIETDNGYGIDVSAVAPTTQINHNSGVLRSCMWLGAKTGLAITAENPEASSAIGQITNDGEATLLTERPDRFCKLYFKPMGTNKIIPSGTVFTSSHSVWLATF